jgi:hypothetical protein
MILAAAPVGLATGLLAWLAAGGASANTAEVDPLDTRLAALHSPRPVPAVRGVTADDLTAMPLFNLVSAAAVTPDPVVRVDGLSRTAHRTAALLSIGGAAAEWLQVGDQRAGVTVRKVDAGTVQLDMPSGLKTLALGEQTQAPAGEVANNDAPPPGMRSPPAPASAPRAAR